MANLKKFQVAVVGATGAVGKEMLSVLQERKFPVGRLRLFSSPRSKGKKVKFGKQTVTVEVLKKGAFVGTDLVFFDASDAVSKAWVEEALSAGAWVVDHSATYRMHDEVPLVVPEVNGAKVFGRHGKFARLVAGPNCSTTQLVLPLAAIHKRYPLKRVVVSTYQSVSGAGAAAMTELLDQTRAFVQGKREGIKPKIFPAQIAFSCIPQIGGMRDSGYTSEEQKIMEESRKILGLPNLAVVAQAIRVPTFRGHAESVFVEVETAFDEKALLEGFKQEPGIKVVDLPTNAPKKTTAKDLSSRAFGLGDPVYVGRLRRDPSVPNGVLFWSVSDNLRKGAALNAVQIGELILSRL